MTPLVPWDFALALLRHHGIPPYIKPTVIRIGLSDGRCLTTPLFEPVAEFAGAKPISLDDFDPSALQLRIMRLLQAGPKSATQIKNHTSGHMYDAVGGIGELVTLGLVEKKLGKFRLTDVGIEMAREIGEDEQ